MAGGPSLDADPPVGSNFHAVRPTSMVSGASRTGSVSGESDTSPWARAEDEAMLEAAAILGTAPGSLAASITATEQALGPVMRRRAPAAGGRTARGFVVGGAGVVLVLAVAMAVALGAQRTQLGPSRAPASLSALAPAQGTTAPPSTRPSSEPSGPTPTSRPTARPALSPRTAPITYHIRRGDTLTAIAARFQVTIKRIVEANRIADPNLIYAGQDLAIPPPLPPTP